MPDQEETRAGSTTPPTAPENLTQLDIAEAWRSRSKRLHEERAKSHPLKLPSGMPVLAIRAPMKWMISFGRIPDQLLPRIDDMIDLIEANDPKTIEQELTDRFATNPEVEWAKFHALLDGCWMASVTFPRFTVNQEDIGPLDEHGDPTEPYFIGEVPYLDKMYVFQWNQGVDETVEEFFRRQREIVGALENGESIQLSPTTVVGLDASGGLVVGVPGGQSGVQVRELHSSKDRGKGRKKGKTKQE